MSYLEILDDLTRDVSSKPGFSDILQHGGGEADENDQKVGHGEIHYEEVGHGSHAGVFKHHETHEEISDQSHHEHENVQVDENPLKGRRKHVIPYLVHIFGVVVTIRVATRNGVIFRKFRRVPDIVIAIYINMVNVLCLSIATNVTVVKPAFGHNVLHSIMFSIPRDLQ